MKHRTRSMLARRRRRVSYWQRTIQRWHIDHWKTTPARSGRSWAQSMAGATYPRPGWAR